MKIQELTYILKVFSMFLSRDHKWTQEQILAEQEVIKTEVLAGKQNADELDYVKLCRIGAKKQLNRKQRIQLQMSYDNATNHAYFEIERYNQGFHDGIASKKMKNPIHNNWNGRPHQSVAYESGYWAGFNNEIS